MADFGGALEDFRAEARSWLEENFPPSLKGQSNLLASLHEGPSPTGDLGLWKDRIGAKGWGTPTWPAEYGGGGLNPDEARILSQEMARAGAFNPISVGMGVTMVGPTILEYGTEEQKRQHIPKICSGEIRWCLGYSEPGAGSDLAALQTKAEDAGDHWVINGQKTWTSGAQYSDWCGCLVRTDQQARKHDGISFLLIDMHQDGIKTRPIKLIAGASPFCETFFDNAVTGKDQMLGALNNGWTVGKRLLQHERASQTSAPASSVRPVPLQDIAIEYIGVDETGKLADPDLRSRIAAHLMHAKAHALTVARIAVTPSNAASVLKNSATIAAQARAELILEIEGNRGLGWEGEGFTKEEIDNTRSWLQGKAMSIYGGSYEVQNNIISKRILGLPDMTKSA